MNPDEGTTEQADIAYCSHCGTENPSDGYSCSRCGERIIFPDPQKPPPMGLVECNACLTYNEAHASYCVRCGNTLDDAARITAIGAGGRSGAPRSQPGGIRLSRQQSPRPVSPGPDDDAKQPMERERHPDRERDQREQARRKAAEQERARRQEMDGENDSGTRAAKLPKSGRGWNTAAFIIGPIWGPANGVWLGLIGLLFLAIPLDFMLRFTLYLAFGAFLGYRGNEMAWRARRWNSLEHFKRVQQQWMLAGLVVTLLLLFLMPLLAR